MNDKKPDVDEFNFDEKTEKNTVLDQSMISSKAVDRPNPAVLVIVAVVIASFVYYMWGSSSATPAAPPLIKKHVGPEDHSAEMAEATNLMPQQIEPPPPAIKKQEPISIPVQNSPSDKAVASDSIDTNHPIMKNLESFLQQLSDRQDQLSAQIDRNSAANSATLKKSHADLKDFVVKTLEDMRKQQMQLQQTIDSLSKKVADSDMTLHNIEQLIRVQAQEFQVSQNDLTSPLPAPKYQLHAVIPGRAWLKEGTRIFAVVQGQELEPYGHIVTIDARQGFVLTSSGQILRYS